MSSEPTQCGLQLCTKPFGFLQRCALCALRTISDPRIRSPAPSALMDRARFAAESRHRPGPGAHEPEQGQSPLQTPCTLRRLRQGTTPPRIAWQLADLPFPEDSASESAATSGTPCRGTCHTHSNWVDQGTGKAKLSWQAREAPCRRRPPDRPQLKTRRLSRKGQATEARRTACCGHGRDQSSTA